MNTYIWKTQLGYFSTQAMAFIDEPNDKDDIIELVIARPDSDTVILADKAYLRETLLFYGFTLPESLQTVTERQTSIQETYDKKLEQALRSITSAKILGKEDSVIRELETRYKALLTEMTTQINEAENEI